MRKKPDLLWLPRFGALLFLALGVVLALWPEWLIGFFPLLIGIILMVVGVQGFFSFSLLKDKLMEPGIKLLQSIMCFVVGLVFLLKQDVSSAFLSILFGLFVLVNSSINLSNAISGKLKGTAFAKGIGESLVGFFWGALLLFDPFSGRSLWARFLGLYFIFFAVQALLQIRGLKKNLDDMLKTAKKRGFGPGEEKPEDLPEK